MIKLCLFLAPPGSPTNLMLVAKNQTTVSLRWNEPSLNGGDDILGYYVERCLSGDDFWIRCNVDPFIKVQGEVFHADIRFPLNEIFCLALLCYKYKDSKDEVTYNHLPFVFLLKD